MSPLLALPAEVMRLTESRSSEHAVAEPKRVINLAFSRKSKLFSTRYSAIAIENRRRRYTRYAVNRQPVEWGCLAGWTPDAGRGYSTEPWNPAVAGVWPASTAYMWFRPYRMDIDTVLTTKYDAWYPVSFTLQPTKSRTLLSLLYCYCCCLGQRRWHQFFTCLPQIPITLPSSVYTAFDFLNSSTVIMQIDFCVVQNSWLSTLLSQH